MQLQRTAFFPFFPSPPVLPQITGSEKRWLEGASGSHLALPPAWDYHQLQVSSVTPLSGQVLKIFEDGDFTTQATCSRAALPSLRKVLSNAHFVPVKL